MTINPRFPIGQTVYLRVATDSPGMVVGLLLRPGNVMTYLVAFGDETDERECFDIELTTEKTFET